MTEPSENLRRRTKIKSTVKSGLGPWLFLGAGAALFATIWLIFGR